MVNFAIFNLLSGKHNYGKSPCSMGKSTINHNFQWVNPLLITIFNSYVGTSPSLSCWAITSPRKSAPMPRLRICQWSWSHSQGLLQFIGTRHSTSLSKNGVYSQISPTFHISIGKMINRHTILWVCPPTFYGDQPSPVGGLEHLYRLFFPSIGIFIIPTDEVIFL